MCGMQSATWPAAGLVCEACALNLLRAQGLERLQAGETKAGGRWGAVAVSNEAGKARSSIELHAHWAGVPPDVLFTIFCWPDNSALFRDIHRVSGRTIVSSSPGLKVIEVEQVSELKILWIRRYFSTWLRVTEDSRDPAHLVLTFDLLRSDVLAEFEGRWDLKVSPGPDGTVGTAGILTQRVMPKGIPPFLRHLPVMSDLLRGVAMRAITRVMEDMDVAVEKIKAGMAAGRSHHEVLRELCGVAAETGHANAAVASFAVDDVVSLSDEEEEEIDPEEAARAVIAELVTRAIAAVVTGTSAQSPQLVPVSAS